MVSWKNTVIYMNQQLGSKKLPLRILVVVMNLMILLVNRNLKYHTLFPFKALYPLHFLQLKMHFFLLLVVRGTDDENTQIDMWIDFLFSHKIDKIISVHVILICSHADLFENELVKKKRVDALLKYFLNNTKTFLL